MKDGFSFQWLVEFILLPMISGSYLYTWMSNRTTRKKVDELLNNHLKHMQADITRNRNMIRRLESLEKNKEPDMDD